MGQVTIMELHKEVLLQRIDALERALATYFSDKDVPIEIRQSVDGLEMALSDCGWSPINEISTPHLS